MSVYLVLAILAFLAWVGIVLCFARYGKRPWAASRTRSAEERLGETPIESPIVPPVDRAMPSPEEVLRDLARRRATPNDAPGP